MPPEKIGLMSHEASIMIGIINAGLSGMGSATIRVSKKGITFCINGFVVAKGKTSSEFAHNFRAAQAKAFQSDKT